MSTTELRDGADGAAFEPDVLSVAPRPVDRRLLAALLAAALVVALAVGGYRVYLARRPPPDFTLAQLEGAYTGMVRSDGTNDVSTITAANFPDPPLGISPVACTPLFATTISNQFPVGAVDGVSTYWLDGGSSVSLFTVRYPDPAAAERAYAEIATAEQACAGQTMRISGGEGSGTLRPVAATAGQNPEQLAYLLDRPPAAGRYALHVMRLSNTVTWQYRYQASQWVATASTFREGQPYDTAPAQQLMDGMARQLLSIQAEAGR